MTTTAETHSSTHTTHRSAGARAHAASYARRSPDRMLDVGPHRVAYWKEGEGPDLVFVHGWPLHAATFRHMVASLSASFTCHLFDLPGTGQTITPADAKVSFVGHAEVVRGVVDALGIERYGLVAHDSGGFVARLLAASDDRARALVMTNTEIPGHHPWQLALYLGILRTPLGPAALRSIMGTRALRRSPLGFGPCFTDPDYLEGEFFELFIRPLLDSTEAAKGQLRAMRSLAFGDLDGLADVHRRIRVPVQLVWGARDTFFPLAKAKPMVAQFGGGAELVEIPEGGLFLHEDRAAEVTAHALPFLTAHVR